MVPTLRFPYHQLDNPGRADNRLRSADAAVFRATRRRNPFLALIDNRPGIDYKSYSDTDTPIIFPRKVPPFRHR